MSELGIPEGIAAACDHKVPSFGCSACILKDRKAFAIKSWESWKKTYKLPKCPGCGKAMLHYGHNYDSKEVRAEVICSGHDSDGVPTCDEHDITVIIA